LVGGASLRRSAADVRAHPVVTIRSSIDALRVKMWDEERG
jgi:hypothetical protein